MKLTNINLQTPRKILVSTMLAASLVSGVSALGATQKNNAEKQKIETVNKSTKDKFVSAIKNIDKYDSKIFEKIEGIEQESFVKENKTFVRFMVGILMSIIGSMVGSYREEKGHKHIAKAESCANLGFASGFILPGVTVCTVFATSIGVILKSLGSNFIKK